MADEEKKPEIAEEKPSEEQTPAPATEEPKSAAPETAEETKDAAPPPAEVPANPEKAEPVEQTSQETIAAPPAGELIHIIIPLLIFPYIKVTQ
jgi:biotin carboxyl carrier protein